MSPLKARHNGAPALAAVGRPAPDAVLALDVGGTKLATGVVDRNGTVRGLRIAPTRRQDGPEIVTRRLFELGSQSLADADVAAPDAVGISCGGPLDPVAGILYAPNHLPGWDEVPITDLAGSAFGRPAYLENDATAATLAEQRWGAGVGVSSFVYLTLSTGIGGGAVLDRRLHRGATGNGGEFGHMIVRPGGRPCSCRRRGCLEAYCSGSSIAERAVAGLSAGASSTLSTVRHPSAADVVRAVRAGDPFACRLWRETTDLLGQAVTDLVNILEPELVVLGGGVSRAGDLLLDPVRDRVAREAMPPAAAGCRIVRSALGDLTALAGAGATAFDRLVTADSTGARGTR